MNLLDIVHRQATPEPWAEGEKIPWNDPAFSARMLKEHLAQDHDAASRRFVTIDKHVQWIHQHVLTGKPTKILDLGCGPGLYTSRFAKLGHCCVGIDFSPASIEYAKTQARAENLPCTYTHQDIRTADYGAGYGLITSIFGEFNVFSAADAKNILQKAHRALNDGGMLTLEPHTFAAVKETGGQAPSWYATESGLFSERPHFCLTESFWDDRNQISTERFFIIDAQTGEVTRHAASMQAYTDDEYHALLIECGFDEVTFYPSLRGDVDKTQPMLMAITARKR